MMKGSLKGKHFLTLEDFTPEELRYLLDLSIRLKKEKKEGKDLVTIQMPMQVL